jgi:hypothetical protein
LRRDGLFGGAEAPPFQKRRGPRGNETPYAFVPRRIV